MATSSNRPPAKRKPAKRRRRESAKDGSDGRRCCRYCSTVNFADLPQEIRDAFFNGTKRRLTFRHGDYKFERDWRGALRAMRERIENPPSEKIKAALEELIAPMPCPSCNGMRLQPESLAVKGQRPRHRRITPNCRSSDSVKKFAAIKLSPRDEKIAGLVLKEIRDRLRFLDAVGLGYLTLEPFVGFAFGRRRPADSARDADRFAASRRALCSRRTEHRPASA